MKEKILITTLILLLGITNTTFPGILDSSNWTISGPNHKNLKKITDNDINTIWDSGSPQNPGVGIIIDLGSSVYVYRIFLTCGKEVSRMSRSLKIFVGESKSSFKLVASESSIEGGDKVMRQANFHDESNFIFNPLKGRYVKIELGNNTTGLSWAVAEISIHGATQLLPESDWLEVVFDQMPTIARDKQPPWSKTLSTASRDLQYYLMELLDQPVRRINSNSTNKISRLRFRLLTPPKEEIPATNPHQVNLDDISIIKKGKEILFGGITARAVAYSVYKFLDYQGVRWLYPDTYGDYVPAKEKLDLSMLPITYRPSFSTRYTLASPKRGRPFFPRNEQASLFFLRNGCNSYQEPSPLMGMPPWKNIKGHFHSMRNIFTPKVEQAHPEWWSGPYRLQKGANAEKGGSGRTPCLSSPEVRDFILQWIENDYQLRREKGLTPFQGYSIMPLDSAVFCECKRCVEMFGKPQKINPKGSNVYWNLNYSDYFFYLIKELGLELKHRHPELLLWTSAYAQYASPPKLIKQLPDNVIVEICIQKAKIDIPMSSPDNTHIQNYLKKWSKICKHLGVVEYALIQQDTTFTVPYRKIKTFSPLIVGQCNWHRREKEIGIKSIGTFTMGNFRYIPWAMYTWCHSVWNVNEQAKKISTDFFSGYYGGDAGSKIKKIYTLVEENMLKHNISLKQPTLNLYAPNPIIFTDSLISTAITLLKNAKKTAKKWYYKERIATAEDSLKWSYRVSHRGFGKITYPCYYVKQPPVIDGKLSDSVWTSLPSQKGLLIQSSDNVYKQQGQWVLKRPTQFRLGWDKKFIYLAVECFEPKMNEISKLDTKNKEAIFVVFGHDKKPAFTRNLKFNLAGDGPEYLNLKNKSKEYQVMRLKDRWLLEAKFSVQMLSYARPDDFPANGVRWPFNLIRFVSQGSKEDTWKQFFWSHTYHGHNWAVSDWYNHIQFYNNTLSAIKAKRIEVTINKAYNSFYQRFLKHQTAIAVFDKHFRGCPNLLSLQKNKPVTSLPSFPIRWFNQSWEPMNVEVRIPNPITLNGLKIIWATRGLIREWYSLEWWDGKRYQLLHETRDNAFHIGIHEFSPIKTSRLRITIYGDRDGNMDGYHSTLIKKIAAYYRK